MGGYRFTWSPCSVRNAATTRQEAVTDLGRQAFGKSMTAASPTAGETPRPRAEMGIAAAQRWADLLLS
jgi:hypothetical protein